MEEDEIKAKVRAIGKRSKKLEFGKEGR